MKSLKPYLIFPGTCEEALSFYATCLHGDIVTLQRYSESHLELDAEHKNRVFNSVFTAGGVSFMASDNLPDQDLAVGANISMFISFSDSQEQLDVFSNLADGGQVLFPLERGFGMVQDKYQIRWMLAMKD